jgi:metal-responsive CopG/Arc/MetJ family transcriptional regulator
MVPAPRHTIWCIIWSVARKEVLVQLDDELVTRLDDLAAAQGTSRSELLRRGAMAVLEADDAARADLELQEAYRRVPQDPALVKAAKRLAARTAPPW